MSFRRILSKVPHVRPAFCRNYAFKSDLKIKWVRPAKIECYKPEKSGDLEPMPKLDKTQTIMEFRHSKELETADDLVRKLFSLEFAPRWKSTQVYVEEMRDRVCRHPLDMASSEAKIAKWTGTIRALQEVMDNFPRNKVFKVRLKELIDKRKKHLKYLRKWDYKRFEWLLENLDIVYKPPPSQFIRVERKASLRKLTDKYCEEIKDERLKEYRLQLEEEQPAFLQEKIRSLEFIKQEQEDCKSEVTVRQEEIDECREKLKELMERRKKKDDD